jgi:hypothetical protein
LLVLRPEMLDDSLICQSFARKSRDPSYCQYTLLLQSGLSIGEVAILVHTLVWDGGS